MSVDMNVTFCESSSSPDCLTWDPEALLVQRIHKSLTEQLHLRKQDILVQGHNLWNMLHFQLLLGLQSSANMDNFSPADDRKGENSRVR